MAEEETKTAEPTVEEQIQTKVEELAGGLGWVPESDWKKKPEDHKTAEEYIRDSKKVIKSEKQSSKALEGKVDRLNSEIAALRRDHKQGAVKDLTAEKDRLEEKRRSAAVDGNEEEYDKLQEKIKKKDKEIVESVAATSDVDESVPDQLFSNWQEDNAWYEHDMEMTAYADDIANEIAEDTPMARRLEIVDAAVLVRFPDAFETGEEEVVESNKASDAETGGAGGTGGAGQVSYDSLPKEGQAACDSFVDQGQGTREEFLKSVAEIEGKSPY